MGRPKNPASDDGKTAIQVIQRLVSLLDALAQRTEPATLKDLSLATALHPSTAHRILNDLVTARLIDRSDPGTYQLGANDLIALKDGGVSEKIIAAMLSRSKGETAASMVGMTPAPAKLSGEPGLYYKKGNEYLELLTEDVEWKTSGAMKSASRKSTATVTAVRPVRPPELMPDALSM